MTVFLVVLAAYKIGNSSLLRKKNAKKIIMNHKGTRMVKYKEDVHGLQTTNLKNFRVNVLRCTNYDVARLKVTARFPLERILKHKRLLPVESKRQKRQNFSWAYFVRRLYLIHLGSDVTLCNHFITKHRCIYDQMCHLWDYKLYGKAKRDSELQCLITAFQIVSFNVYNHLKVPRKPNWFPLDMIMRNIRSFICQINAQSTFFRKKGVSF